MLYVLLVFWGSYCFWALTLCQLDRVQLKDKLKAALSRSVELDRSYNQPIQDSNATFEKNASVNHDQDLPLPIHIPLPNKRIQAITFNV